MIHKCNRFQPTWRRSMLVAGVAVIGLLAACQPLQTEAGGDSSASPAPGGGGANQLTIATGGTGGVYYPLGGGFATVIRENVSGYDASVQETNASVDNMLLIGDGQADLALVLGDTAAEAVAGAGEFEDGAIEACAMGNLYDNYTQLVTSTNAGIASVEDLAGKRVSLGSPGSGTEIIALRILEAAGIDPDTGIDRQQLGVAETTAALRDNTIDAGFWSGGLPTGALVEYATLGGMALVPTADYNDALVDSYGDYYFAEDIPAGTYEGQDEPIPTIVVSNVLVAPTDMPEDLQRQITEAIYENREQLIEVHPAAEELDASTAADIDFMDICPGSQAYFDEQG
jgi:uncharacterized protein